MLVWQNGCILPQVIPKWGSIENWQPLPMCKNFRLKSFTVCSLSTYYVSLSQSRTHILKHLPLRTVKVHFAFFPFLLTSVVVLANALNVSLSLLHTSIHLSGRKPLHKKANANTLSATSFDWFSFALFISFTWKPFRSLPLSLWLHKPPTTPST